MPLKSLTYAPIEGEVLLKTGRFTETWARWFDKVYRVVAGKDPVQLASFVMLELPDPIPEGQMIYVPDATGGSIPAFSDGVNWRRVDTRAIIT